MSPSRNRIILITCVCVVLAALLYWHRVIVWQSLSDLYHFMTDREQVKSFIVQSGPLAPVVFILFQILQVIFAPVPGEATGFIGGYIFGAWEGFVYSSIGLTVGSIINFGIGRFFGWRYVRKAIPPKYLERFDRFIKHQGVIVVFLLFVFPGFPKDYLCLFLGMSTLPTKVFIILASVGRMPGTLLLSLQGEYLFEENYGLLAVVAGLCLIIALLFLFYRESIYTWMDRFNNRKK